MKRKVSILLVISAILFFIVPSTHAEGMFSWFFDLTSDIEEFEFELNSDGSSYSLSEYNYLSKHASEQVEIPVNYNDLPVTKINSRAFYACDKIEKVIIPEGMKSIGSYAFYHCDNLKEIVIPKTVRDIGEYAFEGCDSLTSITIPEAVNIGFRAFYECVGLSTVTIGNEESNITIGASSVEDYAFYGCINLSTVTLGECITYIGGRAFSHCENLTTVNLTNSVWKFGESAFEHCKSLEFFNFSGTMSEWEAIDKWPWWDKDTGFFQVYCTK